MARQVKLNFPAASYHPDILQNVYTEKQLRSEYTRLRDIGQKRIKRLLGSEYSGSATANKWAAGIPRLSEMRNISDISHALSELASFITSPYSSVTGQRAMRREQRDTLERHFPGLDLSSDKKFDQFTKVMNNQVSNNLEKVFGSDRAVILYKTLQSKGVSNINAFVSTPAKMAFWLNNVENLAAVELPKGRHKSAKAYKELIESEIEHGRDRSPFTISGDFSNRRNRNKNRSTGKSGKRRK